MNGRELVTVQDEKDLGILFTNDLKPSSQCLAAYTKKSSRAVRMIRRIIRYKSTDIVLAFYKTLVRPHLEYCTPAWSSHYQKEKALLERVKRRLTRMIPSAKNLHNERRLKILGFWSREERRNRADILEVYKMYNGVSAVPFNDVFEISGNTRTRGHNLKLANIGAGWICENSSFQSVWLIDRTVWIRTLSTSNQLTISRTV